MTTPNADLCARPNCGKPKNTAIHWPCQCGPNCDCHAFVAPVGPLSDEQENIGGGVAGESLDAPNAGLTGAAPDYIAGLLDFLNQSRATILMGRQ